jgi:hypothetical protein
MKSLALVNNRGRVGKTNASTPLYASRTGDLSPPPGPQGPPFSPNRALPAPGTETGASSLPQILTAPQSPWRMRMPSG